MKVKICANKSIKDAQMSIDAGADIIGILVGQSHTSNDFVDKYRAKEICDFVNKRCEVSLVTHLTDANEIISLTRFIGNNIIQLHSDIDEKEVEIIKKELPDVKLVRLIHVSSDGTVCTDYKNMKYADYYLLDSFNLKTNQVGGTGLTHDWNKSSELIKQLDKPTFLAGGLNPSNVKKAIEIANPYGVDVNSGCKDETGNKNRDKVIEFVRNAKGKKSTIIFDLDNTLLFLSDEWLITYNNFIKKHNIDVSSEELFSTLGKVEKDNIDTIITKEDVINYVNEKLPVNFDIELFDELLDKYAYIPLKNISVIDNILSYLSSKYNLIAYTNWFTDNQILRLKINGLDKYFNSVYGWDILPTKPSKKGLEKIVGSNNIKDYIFIGDSIDIDIVLPDSVGMKTIFFNRKNVTQDKYDEIKNIEDLKSIL